MDVLSMYVHNPSKTENPFYIKHESEVTQPPPFTKTSTIAQDIEITDTSSGGKHRYLPL